MEKQFKLSDSEFQPLLKQIFDDNQKKIENGEEHFPINVEPDKIICLRLMAGGGKKYAYVKPITGEYSLLTEAKYFLVLCNEQFDFLPSIEKKKWVLLHEYCHCWYNKEKEEYETVKHNVENFTFLLKGRGEWDIDLVKNYKWEQGSLFKSEKK
jgi:hypothetical protein